MTLTEAIKISDRVRIYHESRLYTLNKNDIQGSGMSAAMAISHEWQAIDIATDEPIVSLPCKVDFNQIHNLQPKKLILEF